MGLIRRGQQPFISSFFLDALVNRSLSPQPIQHRGTTFDSKPDSAVDTKMHKISFWEFESLYPNDDESSYVEANLAWHSLRTI